MSKVIVLVGTRKGCFVLESDGDRRDWDVRGPYCEGWPVYHAIYDAENGSILAAAASDWHGATVWRSTDLGETWSQSSEGLGYDEGGDLKLSKVSSLAAGHGRVLAGGEQAGIFESRDGGVNWTLLTNLDHPASKDWNDPTKQPPGHLGVSAILPHPGDGPEHFWAIVQGYSLFGDARRIFQELEFLHQLVAFQLVLPAKRIWIRTLLDLAVPKAVSREARPARVAGLIDEAAQ